MNKLDEKIVVEILLLLVVDSPYRRDIILNIPKVSYLFNENDALNQAVSAILETSDFNTTKTINYNDCKKAINTIHEFFEYLYFTGNNFLKDVE